MTPLWAAAIGVVAWGRTRRGRSPLPALVTAAADVALVASIVTVLLITMKSTGGDGEVRLSPLVDTWRELSGGGYSRRDAAEVAGNALLLAPTAFLAAWRIPRLSRVWTLTLAGLAFSSFIEVTQLLFRPGRAFELDDLILNTASAAVGAIAWRVVRPWLPQEIVTGRRRRTADVHRQPLERVRR